MPRDGDSGRGRGGRSRGRGGRGRGQASRGQAPGQRRRGGGQGAPRDDHPPNMAALPDNWPSDVIYLTRPAYAGLSPRQRQMLQTQPGDDRGGSHSRAPPLPEIPPILPFGPSPRVAIRTILDPAHPAYGQRGLFAARPLPAGSFIVPYLGIYHRGNSGGGGGTNLHNKHESDYDLWLDRDADVAVDAVRAGNEARFVNDYRGTGAPRANAEFREVWDPRRGERGMAVYVRPGGQRRRLGLKSSNSSSSSSSSEPPVGIAQGEEILVSYGKGFWEMRQKEAAEAAAVGGDAGTGAADEVDHMADRLGALAVGEEAKKEDEFKGGQIVK